MAKNDVTKATANAVAESQDIDIFADAGAGNENLGQRDVTIPRISVVQALSPELKRNKAEYIEGAQEGMLFNSATRELLGEELIVIPVSYQRRFIEWVPRDAGGGLVNPDHDEDILEKTTKDDKGNYVLENGNQIVETPEHFVFIVKSDGSWEAAVISMSKSKARVSRSWNTAIRNLKIKNPATGQMINPARFYGAYTMKTVDDSSDRGDFKNLSIRYLKPVLELDNGPMIYTEAREFFKMIQEGKVKADIENPAEADGAAVSSDTDAF